MFFHNRLFFSFCAVVVLVGVPDVVFGQSSDAEQQARELLNQALESYANMEMDQALEKLDEAIRISSSAGLSGEIPAQIQMTYGVILVLGLNRLSDGRDRMVAAAREDPSIEPDPMISTPFIQQLWQDVVEDVIEEQPVQPVEPDLPDLPDEPDVMDMSDELDQQGQVIVAPISEQKPLHAIPIFVQLRDFIDVGRVVLSYRSPGMTSFLTVEMNPHQNGYAGRVPCLQVRTPQIEYFVSVVDSAGVLVGSGGTEDEPLMIMVRDWLSGDEPRLPGEDPEPSCSGETETPEPTGEVRRLVYFESRIGTGAGIPIEGDQVTNHCTIHDRVYQDIIEISPSLAWTELVTTPIEIGGYILPNLTLGVQLRAQFRGAVYSDSPGPSIGALLRIRYFPISEGPVRFYTHLAGGYMTAFHRIPLEAGPGSQIYCGQVLYRIAGAGGIQVGVGFFYDFNHVVSLGAEFDISVLFPGTALQGDLFVVLSFSVPRPQGQSGGGDDE